MASLLSLALLLVLGIAGAGVAATPSRPGVTELESTAKGLGSPATQREAILALQAISDPSMEAVLRALKDGALYQWKGRIAILGDDGTLKDARGQPLLDAQGQPVSPESGHEAIALEEELFGLVQRILERLEVFGADREARKAAAFKLGGSGDISAIPVLLKAAERETDRDVKTVIEESVAKLQLLAPDPATRAGAARSLARLRSEAALPQLRAMLAHEPDGKAKAAARDAIQRIESFMGLRNIVAYLFNGVSLGAVLLIMSLGLAVTFGLMGIINMAHGEMLMLGSYTAYVVQEAFASRLASHQDYYFFVALPLSFVVAGLVGLALEGGIIRFLYGRPLETLIVTWGIGMIFQQSARLYFGDQTSVNPPTWFRGGVEVMRGLIFPWSRIFIVALSVAALAVLYLLLYRSYAGLRVRAVMQNRAMASCVGVSTRKIDALTFALGTALAGVAGCALALISTVDPEVGKTYIVDAFMVVVLGGVGKLLGMVAASFGIGLSNKILEPSIGGTAAAIYAKVAVLALAIGFLQWRPTGLFPAKGRAAEAA
ncbi:MAG: urea ABC transporter permease subunit UrtB [Candidatus Rokubacteria bacterium]|nr:urea ABC transporter permease subunit UrtB [Candidatus Rokubacteria bacterium]